ncbi:MAG TPA: tetratricopeptide repeat protein, partial [Vicinamibacterales bacterium]|nr:tetratricopeptide repeat protein [Vicinamibacterales bacterium]
TAEVRSRSSSPIWLAAALVVSVAVPASIALLMPNQPRGVEARDADVMPRKVATATPIYAARDAYERGRLALARRSQESLKVSVGHFERALSLSPRFAEAYVGLADSWSLMSSYGLVDPREGMPRARDAANRALTLDPLLARAHASLGRTAMIFDWDWTAAGAHFDRAIKLDAGQATTHQWFAYFLSASARHPEAVEAARRGIASEPLSMNTNTALGYVLYAARRYDEASAHLERTLEIDPDFAQARRNLALVRLQQHRPADALRALKRVAALNEGSPVALAEVAWMHAVNGETDVARRLLASLDRMRTTAYVPPDSMALVYMALGSPDEAVSWLKRAVTMRVGTVTHLPVDPKWDPLRNDPRVIEMTRAIRP